MEASRARITLFVAVVVVVIGVGGAVGVPPALLSAPPPCPAPSIVEMEGRRVFHCSETNSPNPEQHPRPTALGAEAWLFGAPLDLNQCRASDLERVDGIGPSVSARIIAERERRGGFDDVDDLDDVAGIGPALLGRLRGAVAVFPASTTSTSTSTSKP